MSGKKGRLLLLLLLWTTGWQEGKAQDLFTAGPMVHVQLGKKKPRISWGMEASLWWLTQGPAVSINAGFDRKKGSLVLYGQGQVGYVLGGVSAGPYLELKQATPPKLGLQTDYWLNLYMVAVPGLNYRVRYARQERQKALGVYLKAPLLLYSFGFEDWD